jgi:hypothetical protein
MNMICHEAEGMKPIVKPLRTFLQQEGKLRSVTLGKEDILAAVATQDNMINTAWNMKSWLPCHVFLYHK